MERPLLVVTALIKNWEKYLIAQRREGDHMWLRRELPWGKVDFGESPQDAIVREIKEELNMDIKVLDIFDCSSIVYNDVNKHIVLLCFDCEYLWWEIKKLEVADYAWVTKEEFDNYDIVEADVKVINKIK